MYVVNKEEKVIDLRLERVAILVCLFVSVVAICITCNVLALHARAVSYEEAVIEFDEVPLLEATKPIAVDTQPHNAPVMLANDIVAVKATEWMEDADEHIEEMEDTAILNLQENWSDWFLENDNTGVITLWKKSDSEGNLWIALKDEDGVILCTFKYEDVEMVTNYEEWTLCDYYLQETSTRDIVDVSFIAYHEVGGRNAENVQAQAAVVFNRKNSKNSFSNSIHGVINQSGQYACAKMVNNRWLKSDNCLEEEDLEKCFREVLLVFAGEMIEEVPTDVVFAARFKQGKGVWKVIDGTYYCYGWV